MEATHHAPAHPDRSGAGSRAQAAVAASPARTRVPAQRVDWDAVRTASRSCCCPARPAVIALMPPAAGRPHRTDLLLCMHHFRGARQALAAAGASVLDRQGKFIDPGTPAYLAPW